MPRKSQEYKVILILNNKEVTIDEVEKYLVEKRRNQKQQKSA